VIATQTIEEPRARTSDDDPIDRLRRAYPWPEERPEVAGTIENPGWLGEGTDRTLGAALSDRTRIVVELGAWLGMSTRYILEHAPNATVISVDHWQGSPEHRARDDFRAMLPTLFARFLSECWEHRDRIIPLRMTTLEGLRTIAEFGIEPDVIYVDAEHSYRAVTSELELAYDLFPRARLVGDDFDWRGVREAVQYFARRNELGIRRNGARGWSIADRGEARDGRPLSKARSGAVVLVPHLGGIEAACEEGLRELELAGVRVVRRQGSSQIDLARSEMISGALHDGCESILFIDADIGFDPADALRLLDRPDPPVLSGVYAKKGPREVASAFHDGIKNILFGPEAPGLYPLRYAATGFLRIRAEVLRLMIERLKLPLCNTQWGEGFWPFFMPTIVKQPDGSFHYLGEDWAFSHRLAQIGIIPMADTSLRLYHYGPYGYSWEEVGSDRPRYRTYNLSIG
jgi:Methyltransferase domain